MAALQKANRIRTKRKKVLQKVRSGLLSPSKAISEPCLASMTVGDYMHHVPFLRPRKVRAKRMPKRAKPLLHEVKESRQLGNLTHREKVRLTIFLP